MQQILSKRKHDSSHRLGISKYWLINNGTINPKHFIESINHLQFSSFAILIG